MSTMETPLNVDALRSRVRTTQHARSLPLLVVGGLLVNYGVANFAPHPVQWRYGAPLAFVLVWALGKVNETHAGVGPGRADYLVAGGFVFTATNLLLLDRSLFDAENMNRLNGEWVIVVGVALGILSRASRDWALSTAAVSIVATGVVVAVFGTGYFTPGESSGFGRPWSSTFVALDGTVLAVTGLVLYRRERQQV